MNTYVRTYICIYAYTCIYMYTLSPNKKPDGELSAPANFLLYAVGRQSGVCQFFGIEF